ncbi:hypothetical protein BKE30_01655 [Alkanindiges hydrocarboniclasticus]|uniref:DUF3999 domain-containing protein n=1 Tax=Alkanindiges hydrocarboniclasticus TaxID=1907941 RepID=A0A1S8CXS6_9GAMM|nr:DUF3999 family protein [Alkanindiges hydrocarboniclasticus]ONG41999.1 hypothetical protein BKE30_01655 [Alkanindiges hydrocarboniclasticus]
MTFKLMIAAGLWSWLASANAAGNPLSTPITEKNLQGVQQLELNLANIAAYLEQPRQLSVVDANWQVMPMRIVQPVQKPQKTSIPLQIYRWPAQAIFNNPAALNQLQLQLKQGEQQAVVTWPGQPDLNLIQAGTDQSWLLAAPPLPEQLQAEALMLSWNTNDFSSQVQVEGSDNLVDWQFAGLGQVLQTHDGKGQKLVQQRVDIRQYYPFWRLRFDQPLALQQVQLQASQPVMPQWQQQEFQLQKTTDTTRQWQLQLPYQIAIQKMQFEVPANQLWQVTVLARMPQQGREIWQEVGQAELYRDGQDGLNADKDNMNQINFNRPVRAREWRVHIEAPLNLAHLPVQVFAPKTVLYFLAQGTAPYQLVSDPQTQRLAPRLPEKLNPVGKVHLGQTTVTVKSVSTRQYGLWVGLMLLVSVLAVAAWRLYKTMQQPGSS